MKETIKITNNYKSNTEEQKRKELTAIIEKLINLENKRKIA